MAKTPSSSFIPKQSLKGADSSGRRRRSFHVLRFVSTAIFLGSLLLALGTYVYKDYYLEARLTEQKNILETKREEYNKSKGDIEAIRQLDRRLAAAKVLLDNHVSPSKILDALELSTMGRVQFKSFSLKQRPSQDVSLTIIGITQEFKTVALQALEFGKSQVLDEVVFTDLSTDGAHTTTGESPTEERKTVNFNVEGNIPASLMLYEGTKRDGVTNTSFDAAEDSATSSISGSTGSGIEADSSNE